MVLDWGMPTVSVKVCCPILTGLNSARYFTVVNVTAWVCSTFKLCFSRTEL